MQSLVSPPAALPYNTNWSDYGSGYAPAQFFKEPSGLVRPRGMAQWAAGASTTIATLPPGFRPLAIERFQVTAYQAGTLGALDLLANGATGAITVGTWLSVISGTLTVANPSGSLVRIAGGMSAWATAAGATGQQVLEIDGVNVLGVGIVASSYYFNEASAHRWIGSFEWSGTVAFGSHTVANFLYAAVGTVNRDSADWAVLAAEERTTNGWVGGAPGFASYVDVHPDGTMVWGGNTAVAGYLNLSNIQFLAGY